MKQSESTRITVDGLKLLARIWEPDETPPKAAVCLVHGIGEHSGRYEHVARAFANAGYAMSAFDWRGHGKSEGPRGHLPSELAITDEIDSLLEFTRIHVPDLPLILYGHSLGGILVLYYSLKQKPDIKGVIATGTGFHSSLEEQPLKILAARILGSLFPNVSIPSGLDVNAISRDKKVVQAYLEDPLIHDRMTLGFGKIMLEIISWTLGHANEFSLPLLLMHGKSDTIAYPSSSTDFASRVRENCELVIWDEGFHELHNDLIKEEVFETMIKWMDQLTFKKDSGFRKIA